MIVLLPNFGAEEGEEAALARRPELLPSALLWRELFPEGAQLLGLDERPRRFGPGPAFSWLPAEGGVPWLSTERAAQRIARLGLLLAGPDPAAVRRVHDKAFAQRAARALGLCPLGEALRIFDSDQLDDLEAALAALPAGTSWVVKPRFGSSGRGRIPIRGGSPPPLGGAIERLRRRGGALLEPWLDRVVDLSVQLHIGEAVEILGSTRQILAPSGLYLGNRCAIDREGRPRAGTRWDAALEAAALRIGEAARAAGFRGACGIDAFVYRDGSGREVLRPVVELNARYTMGTVALGILRRIAQEGRIEGASIYLFSPHGMRAPGARTLPLPGGAVALLADDPAALD